MIVCHCNHIDHVAIETVADQLAEDDNWRLLTPIAVYKALGKRPRCGGCLPLAANLIHTRASLRSEACKTCPMAVFADTRASDVADNDSVAGYILDAAE